MPALVFAQTIEIEGTRPSRLRGGRVNGRRAPPVDEVAEDAAVTKIWENGRHPRR